MYLHLLTVIDDHFQVEKYFAICLDDIVDAVIDK